MLTTIAHEEVFPRGSFEGSIDVIGAGAVGSKVALSLAALGLFAIRVIDFDIVEERNVPASAYDVSHVGMRKVDALREVIKRKTGSVEIDILNERATGEQAFGDVVFLLTDTMASREEIWKRGLRYKPRTKLMIETRMGKNSLRVYSVNPSSPTDIRRWEQSLYSDDVAEVSACGTTISVGSTADVVAGKAVWQFMRWHQIQEQSKKGEISKDELEFELVESLQPMMLAVQGCI